MNDEVSEFLIAGIVGLFGWFFGGIDGYIKVLIAFTIIDYISGICKAGVEGKISSAQCFKGIARKVIMFSLVGIAHLIDQFLPGEKDAFRIAIILFYVGNEGISIIENAEKLGVPIPKFLHGKFLKFTEDDRAISPPKDEAA